MEENSSDYRRNLVERLKMTADEQTYTWGLLGEIQIAINNRDSVSLDSNLKQLDKQLSILRSSKGIAWLKKQRESYE